MQERKDKKKRQVRHPFRCVDNYKSMHKKKAEKDGKLKEFMAAKTLTKAKKILFGTKTKNMSGFKGWTGWEKNGRR